MKPAGQKWKEWIILTHWANHVDSMWLTEAKWGYSSHWRRCVSQNRPHLDPPRYTRFSRTIEIRLRSDAKTTKREQVQISPFSFPSKDPVLFPRTGRSICTSTRTENILISLFDTYLLQIKYYIVMHN